MNDSKLAKIIRSRWTKLYDLNNENFEKNELYTQLYRSKMDDSNSYIWDYNFVDPVVFYLIRSLLARLNTENMKIKLKARTLDSESKRKTNQRIVDWEIGEINKTLILYNFIYRGLISGRGYLKTGWLYHPAITIESDTGVKTMRNIINRADLSNIRYQDLLVPNKNIVNLEEQPYILERMMIRYGDMLDDNEQKEMWDKRALETIKKKGFFENKVDYGVDIPEDEDDKDDIITKSKYVSVIRMQTKDNEVYYTLEKDEELILNKDRGNPYWHGHYPYITWTPFPEDDEFDSMGAVEPVADLSMALSSILNQYLTNARKSGNPMWIAGQAAAQTPDWMFVNRPDGIIRVAGDVNQVAQIRGIDTTDTMLRMRQEVLTSFERTSAMSSLFAAGVSGGSSPQLNKTATGAKVIDSNIETNLQMLISLFSSMALTKIGEHFLELNSQFITEEQEVKIVGKDGNIEFVKVNPSEITANFDVEVNADTMAKTSPAMRQAQLLNFKATMDQEREVKLNKKVIWKAITNSFQELNDITDDIVLDPEQQAKEAIELLLQGIEPKITLDMDHKAIRQLVQVYMLSNEDMPDNMLLLFTKFVDDLGKYIEAQNTVVTLDTPLPPSNEVDLSGQMGAGQVMTPQPPPQSSRPLNDGKPLSANETDLMKSLMGGRQLASNPTESLPFKLKENQI